MKHQKDFFEFLFADKPKEEFITIFATRKDDAEVTSVKHYKTITGAIEYANKIKNHWNVYVNLATTDGAGRATENQKSRNVIAFDFDLKQMGENFNYKDVMMLFKKHGLYYHILVASGGGFHVYLKTDRTTDINKLVEVNKAMALKLGADEQATLTTQVLRVPTTYNHKYSNRKHVKSLFHAEKILNYNIDKLYQQYVYNTRVDETNLKYIPTKNMPYCIEQILKGVDEGDRDFCLYRLTSYFKRANYSKAQTTAIIKEWNNKCNPPMAESKVEYHVDHCWEHDYKMFGCKTSNATAQATISKYCDKSQCNKIDKYEVVHHNLKTVDIEYKTLEKIKYRGDKKMLNGNHLAVVSVLKVHDTGLNSRQIEQELTSTITKKCSMSKPTRLKVLSELEELGVVEVIKGTGTTPNLYRLKDIKCLENEKVTVSYHATQRFIDGAINQSAYRIYCYMLYRLNQRENVVQEEIARDLNLSQDAISKYINELKQARFLNIHVDYSINPLGANVYEWIY